MRYCSKCGRKLSDDDAFCPGCGNRMNRKSHTNAPSHPTEKKTDQRKVTQPSTDHHTDNHRIKPEQADPNAVQYVYVNKKTGKITNNPNVKTKSEGCLQYVGIAFASVALVIVMVSGTVLLTNYLSDSPVDSDDEIVTVSSQAEISSMEESSYVSSDPVSFELVSSEPVSSESTESDELSASELNKKIKGKWRTDIPYKNMNLPGIFEFDGKGKAKCTIKAFLFSKKFTGTYVIKDGGRCTLKLDGLEEYFDDDTLVGDLRFVTDDQIEFTVDETVWKLKRTE